MRIGSREEYNALKESLLDAPQGCRSVSFLNPYSYFYFVDKGASAAVDLFFIDSSLLTRLLNCFLGMRVVRLSFDYSSIASDFLGFLADNQLAVGVVGGEPSDIRRFEEHLSRRYPELSVCFARNGFFNDVIVIVERFVADCKTVDVVLIGMGAPLQEEVAALFKKSGKAKVAITCGGFITQTAIRDDYYFGFVKRFGLRWAQRFLMHGHVRRKVLSEYPAFMVRFVRLVVLNWVSDLGRRF